MLYISRVEISKFRSFSTRESFDCKDINIFSGKNDSGKSNVLRALNLFFNNETDIGRQFLSEKDFNLSWRTKGAGGAKDVIIKVYFSEGNYGNSEVNNGFSVEKIFKNDGTIEKQYFRNDSTELTWRDNYSEVKRIDTLISSTFQFIYIPAIRDFNFRTKMQGVLERVALSLDKRYRSQELRRKFEDLEKAIQNELIATLSKESQTNLQIQASARVNFSTLLESLNFNTSVNGGSKEVFIGGRGDGIQMQFFFILLAFIAKKDTKKSYIWGCEEPEIAIELAKQFDTARLFYEDFAKKTQLFLTTHSPAFLFATTKAEDDIKRFRVFQDETSKKISTKVLELDINGLTGNGSAIIQSELLGTNYQLLYSVLGEEYLKKISKNKLLSKDEVKKIVDNIVKELMEENESLKEENKKLSEGLEKMKPSNIFICEDENGKGFWGEVLKNSGISAEIYSSNSCDNDWVEDSLKMIQIKDVKYNPKIFREIDSDGLSNIELASLTSSKRSKFSRFKNYIIVPLPVHEIENFILLNENVDISQYESVTRKREQINGFLTPVLLEKYRSIGIKGDTANDKITQRKVEAWGDPLVIFNGKEICKIILGYGKTKLKNKLKALACDTNKYPVLLKTYIDEIREFFS